MTFQFRRPPEPEIVYFVRHTERGIKIGTTCDWPNRIRGLNKEYGPLILIGAELGDRLRERQLHFQFKALRLSERGEWFEPGPELLAYIREHASDGDFPVEYDAREPERGVGLMRC